MDISAPPFPPPPTGAPGTPGAPGAPGGWSSHLPSAPPTGPTPPSPPPPTAGPPNAGDAGNGGRAGALWLTGLGAFMLFAAAAVFVAVRWESLSDEVRLGILATITGASLLAGRRLRPALPATATVLFHLGAFLLPVNTAAVGVHLELVWPTFLLAEGLVAAVAWGALGRAERSPILHVGAAVAVVPAAAGAAAVIGAELDRSVPTAVVLAGVALVAQLLRRHRHAIGWALVAGLTPCLALAEQAVPLGTNVLETLGLAGTAPLVSGLATAALSAGTLAVNARRRRDNLLVVATVATALIGLASTRAGVVVDGWFDVVGVATLFLLAEATAHAARHDDMWARPAAALAIVAEAAMAWLLPAAAVAVGWLHSVEPAAVDPVALLAGAAAVSGFLVADLRRAARTDDATDWLSSVRGRWMPATVGIGASAACAVSASTTDRAWIAGGFLAVAAVLVLARRPGAVGIAAGLAIVVPIVAPAPTVAAILGLAGALLLTAAGVLASRVPGSPTGAPPKGSWAELSAWSGVTVAALVVFEVGVALWTTVRLDHRPATLIGAVLVCWVLAALADAGRAAPPLPSWGLGLVPRAGAVLAVATGPAVDPAWWAVLAGVVGVLAVVDAARHDHPLPLWALAVAIPACVGAATFAATDSTPTAGIAVCVAAVVVAGLLALAEGPWRAPIIGTLASTATIGLLLTAEAPGALGTALILLGGGGLVLATAFRAPAGTPFAWLLVTAGVWLRLSEARVDVLEPYVAPVAVALLGAGWWADRDDDGERRLSSWLAYGPTVVLLAGSALVERLDGGDGWHALVAGAVGVVAVVAGGGRRLVAPLVLGTATLVALTVHESLGVTRQVPTWGWLAAGGTVLLTAGLLLERLDRGPLETGRRLVDAVQQRYR